MTRDEAIRAAARILADYAAAQPEPVCKNCLRPLGQNGPHAGDEHDGCECSDCAMRCWGYCVAHDASSDVIVETWMILQEAETNDRA